jgi:hypothetical protein
VALGHKSGEQPTDPVESALWFFANFSNWGMLHPLDEQKFEDFIGTAIVHGSQWQASDVESRLLRHGMPKALVQKLAHRFGDHMKLHRNKPQL